MNGEQKAEITQYFNLIREKVKRLEQDFVVVIEMIDSYKSLVINTEIEELKLEKAKRWWQK